MTPLPPMSPAPPPQRRNHSAAQESLGSEGITRQRRNHSAAQESLGSAGITRQRRNHSAAQESLGSVGITWQRRNHSAAKESLGSAGITRQRRNGPARTAGQHDSSCGTRSLLTPSTPRAAARIPSAARLLAAVGRLQLPLASRPSWRRFTVAH